MEETKKLLEAEFTEFLIEKVKHAGGSLPFHQLSGLLYSARFEVREEFGTKKKLMKFLKAQSNIFNIDSSSRVTVNLSSSTASDSFDNSDDEDLSGKEVEPVIKTIDGGIGKIIKLHPEFGIIRAFEPLQTNVYFKSDAFSGNKDILLIDTCLQIGCEVYFNAVYGHEDCDVKFCANKVWLNLDTNANLDITKSQEEVSDDLSGEGIIQKISTCHGFILASGKDKTTVFFDKKSVLDCKNMELENYFSIGECVSFSASRTNERNSKCQWEANFVRKKSNENVQSSSHSNTKPSVKNRIENEAGKIYPCFQSSGALIKFGNNELADGNSSSYFFCGIEIKRSDIAYEFDEGDDIFFDAIKTKSAPGWRAVLVWKGDKPDYVKHKIYPSGEEMHETSDNVDASYQRSKSLKSDSNIPITDQVQSKSTELNRAVSRKMIQSDLESENEKFKTSRSSQNSDRKSNWKRRVRHKKDLKKDILMNENKDSYNKTPLETKVIPKSNGNLKLNKLGSTLQPSTKIDNISNYSDENFDDNFCYKDDEFSRSEKSFSDDEFPGILQNGKNSMKERYNGIISSASQDDFVYSDENDSNNESEQCSTSMKKKPSIKKFEDIEGEIVRLYCKAAIIGNSHLQKNIDFVLNMFYVDGKSVEEQQVIDLKEIIKVGDHVNFNCFEIIDDFGDIHQKVTVVWKGPKPNVYEITPQEFIDQYHLSVTISSELISEHLPDKQKVSQTCVVDINSVEETGILQNDKNLMKGCDKRFASASHHNVVYSDENDANNESEQCNSSMRKRPSIKKFEHIEGEIINLYCKAAIIECYHLLQKNANFVLTMFYVDGISVEEQQVIDLKEIIKVGDRVNFSCFEIIDDSGIIHQQVTVVWKGPKPNVYEITPQEFIDQNHLSVTISDELISKHLPGKQKVAQNSLKDLHSFEETALTEDDSSVVLFDSSKDQSGNKMFQQLNIVETDEQKGSSSPDHVHKLLSQRIMNRLKEKGLIVTDLKIDLSDMLAQIMCLVEEYDSEYRMRRNKEVITGVVCSTCSEKNSAIGSCINKNHVAVQTIITGAIIAQSIYTQN